MMMKIVAASRSWRSGAVAAAVAILLLAGCAAPLPPRADVPHGQGLLWRVDKPGVASSYVFGTMHVPDPEFLDLPPAVDAALEGSQHLAVELKTEKEKAARYMERYWAAVLLPGDQSLSDLLDNVSYAQVWRIAMRQRPTTIMIGRYHISKFKPWFVMEVIGKTDATTGRLRHDRPTLDDLLEQRAVEAGKTVVGLESFDEQLAVSNAIPMDDQVALLEAHLRNYNRWHRYSTYADAYRAGDTALLYGLWQQSLTGVEPGLARRYTERFLDDRNRLMVERALPLMEKGTTFVAVGALHLPGAAGILHRLELRGFTVTRLH